MSLLLSIVVYVVVGCGEWYLALRRTLACARGEKALLVLIVFIENLLGLWVLSNFIRTNNWALALSYSAGASAGALIIAMNGQKTKPKQAFDSLASSQSYHDRALAVGEGQRMLFDIAQTEANSDHEAPTRSHTAARLFHQAVAQGLKFTQKASEVAGRERWRHYFPSRRRNRQRIECSG